METGKTTKQLILIVALFFFSQVSLLAQSYTTAIGARLGGTSGATFKHFYNHSSAFEGILGFFGNGFSITGLAEKHLPAFDTRGLNFYYGAGAHLAIYNNRNVYYNRVWRDVNYQNRSDIGIGINGILGFEYAIHELPLAFSVDLKPFIEVGSGGFIGFSPDPSIGVKLLFR